MQQVKGSVVRELRLRGAMSVRDFGIVGDGVTDVSALLQTAINAAAAAKRALFFPGGVYICKSLTLPSDTALFGIGRTAILRLSSSALTTDALIRNSNTAGGANTNFNISLEGLVFDGDNAGSGLTQTRFTGLVEFIRAENIRVRNCAIGNIQYIALAFGGCRFVTVESNEFWSTGYAYPVAEAGPAVWFGPNLNQQPTDAIISHNQFRNLRWAGIYCSVTRAVINNNHMYDVKEAGIFFGHEPSIGIFAREILVTGNSIKRIRKNNISSSGIECGGDRITIVGNQIEDSDHSCIVVQDGENVLVADNICGNASQNSTYYGVIDILVTASNKNCRNIIVKNNYCYDNQTTPTSRHGISITNFDPPIPLGQNIRVIENVGQRGLVWTANEGFLRIRSGRPRPIDWQIIRNSPPNIDTSAVAFKVSNDNASLSIPSQVETQLIFTAVVFDTNSWYNTATGRYTPQEPGFYNIQAKVYQTNMQHGNGLNVALKKNGVLVAVGTYWLSANASTLCASVSDIVEFNGTTDYIELFVTASALGFVQASVATSYIEGFKIGSN